MFVIDPGLDTNIWSSNIIIEKSNISFHSEVNRDNKTLPEFISMKGWYFFILSGICRKSFGSRKAVGGSYGYEFGKKNLKLN